MKKLFTILFLICSLTVNATKYYISTTGTDGAGVDGSIGTPWRTLSYACTRAITSGDTVIVGIGTFSETTQSAKRTGVSIYGAGVTSIITTAAALNPIILCSSASEGTSDNSSISYIKIDGNSLVALSGISVYARSNISIHHCTFVDIMHWAILMCGRIDHTNGAPTTYATGNSINNNTIINCSSYDTWGRGAINFAGQDGILIINNPMSQTGRIPAPNQTDGYLIKAYPCEGHNKAFKIYDNTLITHSNCNIWRFAIELFNTHGGAEVYSNTIQGTVDIGSPSSGVGTDDLGSYGFALKIYENLMVNDAPQTSLGSKIFGVDVEGDISGGVYIYRNKMVNCASGVHFSQTTGKVVDGVYIYYNVMNGIGISGYVNYGSGVRVGSNNDAVFSNIEILNNTINANELTTSPQYGIYLNTGTGLCSNFIIRNNICHGFNDITDTSRGIRIQTCIIDSINVDKNNLYDCRNSNDIEILTSTLTNSTQTGNIKVDPLFVTTNSNFHLQSGSLCIDEGLDVGLITDYLGHSKYGDSFDIGAYEYGKWYIKNGLTWIMNNGQIVSITQ